jgi:nitroreductase
MDMENSSLYQTIFKRKSVRKIDPSPLDQVTLERITSQFSVVKPMLPGIRTEMKLMTSKDVRGMFKVDAPHFLAIFSEEKEGFLLNAGFMMQQMDLFLSANGIGSCWQGGPKPTKEAEKVAGLEFVVLLAFGKPLEKVHRESLSEFKRRPLSDITNIGGKEDLIEPARLAPSGMNNQPWFFVDGNGAINAYYHKSIVADHMNQISVGIAISHIWLTARHIGKEAELTIDPTLSSKGPKGYAYAASLRLN